MNMLFIKHFFVGFMVYEIPKVYEYTIRIYTYTYRNIQTMTI